MATPSIAAERTSQTRAIERLEELLPLVTRYTAALTAESFGPALDEAQAAWNADSGIPRDFAALELRDCIARFRANMAGIPAPEGVTEEDYITLTLQVFTDGAARLSDHEKPIGPAFVARMIHLIQDPTRACPALRY